MSMHEQLITFFEGSGIECDDVSDDYQFITLKRPDGMKLYLMAELNVRKHYIGTSIDVHLFVPEGEEQ